MNRFLLVAKLFSPVLIVMGLASCDCSDREERIAKARARQGIVAAAAGTDELLNESEGARLYRERTCVTCHGDDGIHPILPSYPVLARQGQEYLLQQIKDIQSGDRSNGQTAAMKAVITEVTEEEMIILADFIANELGGDAPIGTGVVDPESPGAKLYNTKTCWGCHGKDALTPILPEYPKIAGHNAEYALQQMRDIKSGDRANSMAVMGMQGVMHLVNDQEMEQLAEYISTLPR